MLRARHKLLFPGLLGGGGLDPDAAAYAETVSLTDSQRASLSSFLRAVKGAGVTEISELIVANSEWNSRSGSTYRAVIGNDGTVNGTVTDTATGMDFSGASGNYVSIPNPQKAATQADGFMLAFVHSDDDEPDVRIASAYGGASDRGFDLGFETTVGVAGRTNEVAAYVSPNGSETTNRFSVFECVVPGVPVMVGWTFAGTDPTLLEPGSDRPFYVLKDLHRLAASNTTANYYSDSTHWRLGERPDGFKALDGAIQLFIAGTQPITEAQQDILHAAAVQYGIITPVRTHALIAVGDSMTNGQAGGVDLGHTRTGQLMGKQDSDWRGGLYENIAVSGEGIDSQEGYFAEAKARLVRYPASVAKWVMFWGGYNIRESDWETTETRDAILQRYLDMAEEAAQAGISSIHWSKLQGYNSGDPPTAPEEAASLALHDDWNAKYQAGIEALQDAYPSVRLLWYDHRITYPTEFDGSGRTSSYFNDSRHLSESGQQVLVADFIARFSAPAFDTDAEALMDELTTQGQTLTGSEKEAINAWFCEEKTAGTYSSLKHVYWPIWGSEAPNGVNWITAARVDGFSGTVTHADGYAQGNGVDGYFDMGESPTDIGITNDLQWLGALVVGSGPGISEALIGARTDSNRQSSLQTNSAGDLFTKACSPSAAATTYNAELGLISGGRKSSDLYLALRDSSGRSILATEASSGGTPSLANFAAMANNVAGTPGSFCDSQLAFYAVGVGLTDAEDEATTARLARLYTALTGNDLPTN